MASFWRYVNFSVADPAAPGSRGWTVPWSADDLARRHWYTAVQAQVEPLDLTPADWQWLRQVESDWWLSLRRLRQGHPQVDFIYSDLFVGRFGERRQRLACSRSLLRQLRAQAQTVGKYRGRARLDFWRAVWADISQAKDGPVAWPASSRWLGRQIAASSEDARLADWSELPPLWREVLSEVGERVAESRAIRQMVANWTGPITLDANRVAIVSARRLTDWVSGWAALQAQLLAAKPGRTTPVRREAWRTVKEFYWHEIIRGLSEADLLCLGVASLSKRKVIKQQIADCRRIDGLSNLGQLQRDMRLLTGRHAAMPFTWHRQTLGGSWRQLSARQLTVAQVAKLVEAWGESLFQSDWPGWTVAVDAEADSWGVEPLIKRIVIPDQPSRWSWSELVPIVSHELTHVWQTIEGGRSAARGLAIWHQAGSATQPLAEAGAMRTERAIRHLLGGPDQSRQYYLGALRTRRRGGGFAAVLGSIRQGLARQEGWRLAQVPTDRRHELARQAWRRALRLYRPTLPLTPSRRLLNDEQLKYVESALLIDDLDRAGLACLLSINTVDLTRWPLYRRLGFDVAAINPFPLDRLVSIIKETIKNLP